ncbi:MAG: EamA family transporter, partial [Pseudomonadota bacterium]
GLTAHFSVTKALSMADASLMAPVEFLRLPTIAVVAALVFGQPLEWAVFAGGALILAGNVVNIRAARAPKREG